MTILWSGHDDEGNTVSGSVPVTVRPRPVLIDLAEDDTDQAPALNAALAALADGTTAFLGEVGQPKRVRLDATVNHPGRGITVDGRGRPLDGLVGFVGYTDRTGIDLGILTQQGTSNRPHWKLPGSQAGMLRGIGIEGPNTERNLLYPEFARFLENKAFEHAISVQVANNVPSRDVVVEDFTVTQVYGDGAYVGSTGPPNEKTTIRRGKITYCGRQQLGLVNFDGLLVEDVEADFGGSSGCDVEPNHVSQYARNAVFRRVAMGSLHYPWIIGGGVLEPGRREHFLLEDTVGRRAVGNHTAILASRLGRDITIRRHVDLRQPSRYGMIFTGWDGVKVEGGAVSTSKMSVPSYAVRLTDCSGPLSITGGVFNGRTEGFDELFSAEGSTDPLSVAHSGNEWAMGTRRG